MLAISARPLRAMSRSSLHFPLDFIMLNLQLDIKQFLLHVLLVQAASPPPVQAASPSIPLLPDNGDDDDDDNDAAAAEHARARA